MIESTTVGGYLAQRLRQHGLERYFAIPGDYNLALLDEFVDTPGLEAVYCCNELNAGYAADGYARATGLSALLVTFNAGAFSAINAIAGAYAESLPVVFISGGPNTNSLAERETLHHTINGPHYDYQRRMIAEVTVADEVLTSAAEAPHQIDRALEHCLRERKPVYIEVAANLAAAQVPMPIGDPPDREHHTDPTALAAACDRAAELLNGAVKPVLVAGSQLRSWGAIKAFERLAQASGYAVAVMPDAKGMVSEQLDNYIGTYWGSVGTPGVASIVESADWCLFAGPIFSDYTTVGHSALIRRDKLIDAGPLEVTMPNSTFDHVRLADFLDGLAERIKPNPMSLKAYQRIKPRRAIHEAPDPDSPLTNRHVRDRLDTLLSSSTTLLAETGDSWFNALKTKLPEGCGFEIQMKYGSIGWSVGATLGYSIGSDRRVVALIGDGSFQMTAQELSTIARYKTNPIIVLVNNGGYTIEVEIHDGPYNVIQNWDYCGFAEAVGPGGQIWTAKATTVGEYDAILEQAKDHDGPVLLEVVIDRDDCTRELLEWGSRVATNNSRPPAPPSTVV
jgi:pyruvate decarboxylase